MDYNNFVLLLIIAFIFSIVGYFVGIDEIKKEAIQRGFGIHCPINGKFAWIDECDE